MPSKRAGQRQDVPEDVVYRAVQQLVVERTPLNHEIAMSPTYGRSFGMPVVIRATSAARGSGYRHSTYLSSMGGVSSRGRALMPSGRDGDDLDVVRPRKGPADQERLKRLYITAYRLE
jgi:hypothetical protein